MNKNYSNISVLIVDDSAFQRVVIKNTFLEMGITKIFEAIDGNNAIEEFKKHNPDLITMDINMPVLDGSEATKAILKIDSKAKIIMITSVGQEYLESLNVGAKYILIKPVPSKLMLELINKLFPDNQ